MLGCRTVRVRRPVALELGRLGAVPRWARAHGGRGLVGRRGLGEGGEGSGSGPLGRPVAVVVVLAARLADTESRVVRSSEPLDMRRFHPTLLVGGGGAIGGGSKVVMHEGPRG